MKRAIAEEERKEYYGTLIVASAATLEKSDPDSVENFQKLLNVYSDMFNPEAKKSREQEGQKMEQMFQEFFKSGEAPEPIQMDFGEPVDGNMIFDNKNVKDLSGGKK